MVESTEADLSYTLLPDPLNDRPMKDSECLILSNKPIDDKKLWKKEGIPDWKMLKDYLCREGLVTKS